MGLIVVYGPSGFGKSRGIKNLDPKTTFVISADDKELPWRGWANDYKSLTTSEGKFDIMKSNYYEGDDPRKIVKLQKDIIDKRPDIKTIVYDTVTHMMTSRYFSDPNTDWDFYKALAKEIGEIIRNAKKDKSRMHIIIGHSDYAFDQKSGKMMNKMKTIGKLLDDKLDPPSLTNIVLIPDIERKGENITHSFITQSDGTNNAKSPEGMFDYRIPNDYQFVIDKYYEYQTGEKIIL